MIRLPSLSCRCVFLAIVATFVPCVASFAAQQAEPAEPIAVVSLAGYDQWHENVAMIGELSGSPDLAQGLEAMLKIATANRGAAGLDKTRPWMAVLIPVGPLFTAYACLPVDDLDALIDVVRPLTAEIETDRGTHKITFPGGQTIYVARHGDWAVVTLDPTTVGRVPADPLALVGDLPKNYDVAVRLHAARVPEPLRALIFNHFDGFVAEQAVPLPDEDEATHAGRRAGGRLAAGMVKTVLTEMDEVTVGLAMDRSARRLTADVLLVPKQGTPSARRWSEYADRTANESPGFNLPNATATVSWSFALSELAGDMLVTMIDACGAEAMRDIERSTQRELVDLEKKRVAGLFDLAKKLATAGSLEGFAGVVSRDDATGGVAAMRFPPDGNWRDEVVRHIAMGGRYPDVTEEAKGVVDRHGEVLLYTFSRPIPEDADDGRIMTRLFGEETRIVLGVGKEHLYLASGRDAFSTLREVLAASVAERPKVEPRPLDCSVALADTIRLAADCAEGTDRESLARMADVLKESPGKDHIRLTVDPADRGIRISLELEEGALRLIAPALGALGGGF